MTLFFSFIVAVFVTMALIPPLMRSAVRLQIIDIPDARKVHTGAIPRIGGVAMVAGAILPMIMWLAPQNESIAFLLGVGIILFFGVWDDRKNLDYRLKFLGQIIAVLVVAIYGGVVIKYVPFWGLDPLPDYLSIPLTVFVLLGITNAINLSDGLDGLAGGTTLMSLGVIAFMAYAVDGLDLVLIAVSVMGAILGFLRYNTHPARIFMGDGGSQFLGFSVGVLAIMLTQQLNPAFSPVVPVIILGLPILDTLMVMGQRIYEGRSPFSPDKNHIHHKLLALGFDHYEAVVLIYLVQSVLVLGGFFLCYQSDLLILSLYLLFCVTVIVSFRVAAATGWRKPGQQAGQGRSFLARWVRWLREDYRLLRAVFYFSCIAIPSYLILVSALVESVALDVGLLAAALFLVMLVFYFRLSGQPFSLVERAVAYVAAVIVVYLAQAAPGLLADFMLHRNIFFVTLAVAVAIGFRFSRADGFRMSPMDFLVIFIAIAVPNLPGSHFQHANVGEGIAKLIVLFYGIELVLSNIGSRWNVARYAIFVTLGILGLRGIWG